MTSDREAVLDWSIPWCLDIGRALLAGGATARELADAIGTHQSNVKKRADALVEAGLLVEGPPARAPRRRGAAAATYLLVEGERDRVAALADEAHGDIDLGQHVVFVQARAATLGDLFAVVAETRAAARARRVVFLGGEHPEYAIFFRPDDGDAALELAAALEAAEVDARVAILGRPVAAHEFVRQAQRSARTAHAARVRGLTRRAAG